MIAIILFTAVASSLFATPIGFCEVVERAGFPSLGIRELHAGDHFSAVSGYALGPDAPVDSLDLAGEDIEIPAAYSTWVSDTLNAAQDGGSAGPSVLDGASVLEAWSTYNGAHWLRCRLTDGREALVFEGRRGQFNQHSCGWTVDFAGAERVLVLTTDPARLPDLVPGIPHEAIALPKPADWASPEARAQVVHFAVGNAPEHSGWLTSMRGPAFPHPGGWTYQDVTNAHGTILYEGASEEEAQRVLDAWLTCPGEGYCYTHRPAAALASSAAQR